MIIFATKYDAPTEACHSFAVALVTSSDTALLAADACRENLIKALSTHDVPLFVMSHGKTDTLIDQNRESALSLADTHLLHSRSNFAFACHSATELGKAMAAEGGTWWGYTGSISAPSELPECFDIFLPIFQYIVVNFSTCHSASDVHRIMRELKDSCEEANDQLDSLDLNDMEAYLYLRHIWDRLRVWLPNEGNPLMHPQATSPITIID